MLTKFTLASEVAESKPLSTAVLSAEETEASETRGPCAFDDVEREGLEGLLYGCQWGERGEPSPSLSSNAPVER